MKPRNFLALSICFALPGRLSAAASADANWPQFRGPNGSGVANAFKPPVKIVMNQTAWKTPLPRGKSSPVLWNGRIFLTGVEAGRLATLALDAKSGKVLWKKLAAEVRLESVHTANSVAASTPCVDEHGVYVYFGSYGLLCYDHDGRELWRRAIPTPKSMYGVSTSPILCEQRLILVADDDANLPDSKLSRSKVIALDKATGEKVWETPRPYNRGVWSTPMIWKHERGTDLVVLGNGRVYGYEPATGAEKWYAAGFAREPIAVPVAGDGQLYVSVANVRWNLRNGIPEIPSPIFHSGRLYLVRDGGILSCVRADTGAVVYRERLGATGQYLASPVIAGDHLYLFSVKGMLTVVKSGDAFEIVHQADLKASIAASPAMDQNSLYVRTDDALLVFR